MYIIIIVVVVIITGVEWKTIDAKPYFLSLDYKFHMMFWSFPEILCRPVGGVYNAFLFTHDISTLLHARAVIVIT